ncbi:MAG: hypothetical protein Q9157_003073 [Trypethelium eluteriae]
MVVDSPIIHAPLHTALLLQSPRIHLALFRAAIVREARAVALVEALVAAGVEIVGAARWLEERRSDVDVLPTGFAGVVERVLPVGESGKSVELPDECIEIVDWVGLGVDIGVVGTDATLTELGWSLVLEGLRNDSSLAKVMLVDCVLLPLGLIPKPVVELVALARIENPEDGEFDPRSTLEDVRAASVLEPYDEVEDTGIVDCDRLSVVQDPYDCEVEDAASDRPIDDDAGWEDSAFATDTCEACEDIGVLRDAVDVSSSHSQSSVLEVAAEVLAASAEILGDDDDDRIDETSPDDPDSEVPATDAPVPDGPIDGTSTELVVELEGNGEREEDDSSVGGVDDVEVRMVLDGTEEVEFKGAVSI